MLGLEDLKQNKTGRNEKEVIFPGMLISLFLSVCHRERRWGGGGERQTETDRDRQTENGEVVMKLS